jgi:hypothetical protein
MTLVQICTMVRGRASRLQTVRRVQRHPASRSVERLHLVLDCTAARRRAWPADPGQRVRIRYVHGDQFCEVVEEPAGVIPTRALVGRHVILDGRKEQIIDAGEERTDDKGYRVIRVELAGGRVCDLLAPVETLD